jgi:Inner membrane protein YgaP-like, transmembrane domain
MRGRLISIKAGQIRAAKVLTSNFEQEPFMSVNVGIFDRIARIVIGAALIAFALGYLAPGTGWNWVGWIGVVPVLTALFGTCPAYSVLGVSTR